MSVRDARPDDAKRIGDVARASWTDTYRDIFEPEFIADFLERNYAEPALAQSAERAAGLDDRHLLVAERDGEVIAYAHYGVGPRGPELFRIYADPAHFGAGAGHALLEELHRRISGVVDSYVLDVHSRNERGRAFYDRHGFVLVGGGSTPDCDLTLRRTLRSPRPELPIETARLRIRALEDADAARLHEIYGDAETMRFVGRSGMPTPDLAATQRSLTWLIGHDDLHGFSLWGIDEREGEPLVAIAGLLWLEGHGPEVEAAYLVRRDRWGRGYATEALREVLRVGREDLGLQRVVALSYLENEASRRVMEKAGMHADGDVDAYGRTMRRHATAG